MRCYCCQRSPKTAYSAYKHGLKFNTTSSIALYQPCKITIKDLKMFRETIFTLPLLVKHQVPNIQDNSSSTFMPWRNGSNNPFSQNRSRIKCIKILIQILRITSSDKRNNIKPNKEKIPDIRNNSKKETTEAENKLLSEKIFLESNKGI